LLQNRAILRNVLQTTFVRLTYDSQCCATQRKRAQFVSLELEIRCSIRLSYGRRQRGNMSPVNWKNPAPNATASTSASGTPKALKSAINSDILEATNHLRELAKITLIRSKIDESTQS
jgi:hypothetical protein